MPSRPRRIGRRPLRETRAACLNRAADLMQARMPTLLGLIVREAGKSIPNAIAEVREAIDFLRYYAAQARDRFRSGKPPAARAGRVHQPVEFSSGDFHRPGSAALAAGNPVLAKPAEETCLIAAEGVRILARGGRSAGRSAIAAGGWRRRRRTGCQQRNRRRDVHRIDGSGAAHPASAGPAALARRPADPADRRDRADRMR